MNIVDRKKLSLVAITWPIFIESFLHMILRSADTFMLSKVSDAAAASVGVSNQLIMFIFFLFNFVATGSAIVIAQYLGARKYDVIPQLTGNAISLNFLFGLLISLSVFIFSTPLIGMFGLEKELFTQAEVYLRIVGGMVFIQAVMLTVSAIVQVHGFTRDTMIVTVGMNLLNIVGNYLLIFGALGFPKLGVAGAAVSTVISQALGLVVMVVVLIKRVKLSLTWKEAVQWKKDHIKMIVAIGGPVSVGQLSYTASQIVTTSFITSLGAQMLATRIYTQNIIIFIMVLSIALAKGTQIMIGHYVGAGEKEEAYQQAFRNLKFSIGMALGATAIICVFREPLFQLFTDDPIIIAMGTTLLLLGFLLEPGRCFNILMVQSLQAAGDSRFPMLVQIILIWTFTVPVTYLLGIHFGFGLIGMWAAFIADEWLRGMIVAWRWKSRAWDKKALVQSESATMMKEA